MSDDNFTFQRCRANATVDKREKMVKYEKKKKIDIKSFFQSPKHATIESIENRSFASLWYKMSLF